MRPLQNNKNSTKNVLSYINPNWYLLFGIITLFLAHLSFSVDLAGWISVVPFLLYLHTTKGWKSRFLFSIALIVAWSAIVFKIITPPLPYVFIFLYSIPIGLVHLPAYLLWDRYKNHKWGLFLFPSLMVVLEWIQYTFTPLASWGVAAYTQLHSLEIMQTVAIFGMAGLSFLIYWFNTSIAELILTRKLRLVSLHIPVAVFLVLLIFGALRTELSKSTGKETITIAAVGTDSSIGGLPLPSRESNEQVIKSIFSRTKKAAKLGAKVIVWNEAAFFLETEYELAWVDSIKLLSKENGISIVASYVVPLSDSPFKFENKYLFINSNGQIDHEYNKHEPVPGEPAIKGKETLKTISIDGTKIGGAICYDYDFPYLAKGYGKLNADIVTVPSSDWRGIDPLHTRMAAFRATEQGHSVFRSTRFGLSAAITPYGEMIYQQSSFDTNNKIMIAQLPVKGIKTIYSVIGDVFVYCCIGFIGVFFIESIQFRNSSNYL